MSKIISHTTNPESGVATTDMSMVAGVLEETEAKAADAEAEEKAKEEAKAKAADAEAKAGRARMLGGYLTFRKRRQGYKKLYQTLRKNRKN